MSSAKQPPNQTLWHVLHVLIDLERDLEKAKSQLSVRPDFNLIDAFRLLDPLG